MQTGKTVGVLGGKTVGVGSGFVGVAGAGGAAGTAGGGCYRRCRCHCTRRAGAASSTPGAPPTGPTGVAGLVGFTDGAVGSAMDDTATDEPDARPEKYTKPRSPPRCSQATAALAGSFIVHINALAIDLRIGHGRVTGHRGKKLGACRLGHVAGSTKNESFPRFTVLGQNDTEPPQALRRPSSASVAARPGHRFARARWTGLSSRPGLLGCGRWRWRFH